MLVSCTSVHAIVGVCLFPKKEKKRQEKKRGKNKPKKDKEQQSDLKVWCSTSKRREPRHKTNCWSGENLKGRYGARVAHIWTSVKALIGIVGFVPIINEKLEQIVLVLTWAMIVVYFFVLFLGHLIFLWPRPFTRKRLERCTVVNWHHSEKEIWQKLRSSLEGVK